MLSANFLSPWAARYAELRHNLAEWKVQDGDNADLTEIEWQSLWFAGEFGREHQTTCGRKVEIVQFGHWNRAAGPDFVDTAIRVDGELLAGPMELDREARDWERHGHALNPAFETVVLHLFLEPGGERFFTRTAKHRNVFQVHLRPELLDEAMPRPALAEARLGRCSYGFQAMSTPSILAFLRAAAHYRLEQKGRRLARVREAHGADQAMFQGIAEALGYRPNRAAMRVLAQRASLVLLRKKRNRQIDALLFGVAGFLEGERHVESDQDDTRSYQRELWSHWWAEREAWQWSADRALPWQTSGVRPLNHPQRRLAALAMIALRWGELADLLTGEDLALKSLSAFFAGLSHPYWDYHYTLKAAPSRARMALVGKERVLDILANYLLPMRLQDKPEIAWRAYEKLPAVQDNEKLRRASIRLFGEHPDRALFGKFLHQQQALLQVYDDFCLPDQSGCEQCPFPEQMMLHWPQPGA